MIYPQDGGVCNISIFKDQTRLLSWASQEMRDKFGDSYPQESETCRHEIKSS